jgi:O-antigen biosynthesis protein WbqP
MGKKKSSDLVLALLVMALLSPLIVLVAVLVRLTSPGPALFNQDDLIAMRTDAGVHELLPGLTGWAQVNGRDELPILDKVRLDAEYFQKRSFGFDLWILWLTLLKVLRRDGVSH